MLSGLYINLMQQKIIKDMTILTSLLTRTLYTNKDIYMECTRFHQNFLMVGMYVVLIHICITGALWYAKRIYKRLPQMEQSHC